MPQRAFNGTGHPTTKVFADWSKWHNDVPALTQDTAQAEQLVDAAKAKGFDGRITYVTINNPTSQAIATSVQAMLNAVGFSVDVQYTATVTDMVTRLFVNHDFDLTSGSNSISDALAATRLTDGYRSDSGNNILGYANPDTDRLLDEAKSAVSDAEKKQALRAVSQNLRDDVPMVPVNSGANFVAWNRNVHGALPSNDGIMLLGKTWLKN